jgi:hypothetical protein
MTRSLIGRGAFALVVAGSLGFGVTQAFAEPAAKRPPGCDKFQCIDWCAQSAQKGVCVLGSDGYYFCRCY